MSENGPPPSPAVHRDPTRDDDDQEEPISVYNLEDGSLSHRLPYSESSSMGYQRDKEDDGSTFFDSLSRQWVKIDNFAFARPDNHFVREHRNESSPPSVDCDENSVAEDSESERNTDDSLAEQPNEVCLVPDTDHQPKILSPRDASTVSRQLKKVSDEMLLPSRSDAGTPRQSSVDESFQLSTVKDAHPTKSAAQTSVTASAKSAIPRFVRKHQSRIQKPSYSPVQKKVLQSQSHQAPAAECREESAGGDILNAPKLPSNFNRTKSRSVTSLLYTSGLSAGSKNSRSDGSLNLVGKKREYRHVKSKVREYIEEVRRLPSRRQPSPPSLTRKSLSLSNLAVEGEVSLTSTTGKGQQQQQQSNLRRMKTFISTSNLEDLRIVLRRENSSKTEKECDHSAATRFDRSRLARLLDNLSDDEDGVADGEDLSLGVEEVLLLAWEERKEKQEAEKVLSHLQENYDVLQRKFADAENTIDKLRFHRTADGGFNEGSTNYGASTLLDSAITDPNSSSLLPSSLAFGNLNAPRAAPALESAAVAAHPTKGVSHYFHGNGSGGAFNDGTKGVPRESASGGGGGGEARSHGVAARNLKELADQLYGLELLSGLSSMERQSALTEMRRAFQALLQQTSASTTSSTMSDYDIKCEKLLHDIGEKLSELELRTGLPPTDRPIEKASPLPRSESLPGIDPITKVNNWRSANPSCYGSGSIEADSPAPPKEQCGESPYDDCSPPGGGGGTGAEFDSGYPGSDRSGVNRTGRSGSFAFSSRGATLGNVEEEEAVSLSREGSERRSPDSSIPSEYIIPLPPGNCEEIADSGRLPPNVGVFLCFNGEEGNQSIPRSKGDDSLLCPPEGKQHLRGVLHSITDLSSDERSMFDKAGNASGGSALASPRPPQPFSSSPRSPSTSAITTSRQPAALAEQIDKEIVELRNFFDDHREEMMSLIRENSQELFPNGSNMTPPSKLQKQHRAMSERRGSGDSSTDIEFERKRMEFAKRRQDKLKKRQLHKSLPSVGGSGGGCTPPDLQEKMETPNFLLGELQQHAHGSDIAGPGGISALFPAVLGGSANGSRRDEKLLDSQDPLFDAHKLGSYPNVRVQAMTPDPLHSVSGGRVVDTADGKVFIPRLNLDSMWTDQSMAAGANRDPRSFDFNQSWPGYDNEDPVAPVNATPGPLLGQSPGPLPPPPTHMHHQQPPGILPTAALPQVVVVHSGCCHYNGDSVAQNTGEKKSSSRMKASSSCVSGHVPTTSSQSSVKSKRKSKAKEELRALLATLEQANAMAKTLRDRSNDIVQVLGNELDATSLLGSKNE